VKSKRRVLDRDGVASKSRRIEVWMFSGRRVRGDRGDGQDGVEIGGMCREG
jgi:hypothetical protein